MNDETRPQLPPMKCSTTFAQVATALAKAQGAFPPIPRDRTVTVDIKDKETRRIIGNYSYKYAPLETIIEKTRPALSEAQLATLQSPELVLVNDKMVEVVRTVLVHSSGEWMAVDIPLFFSRGQNAAQDYGSSLTYARRYGMTLLLCVAADDDDDAQRLEGSERPGHAGSGRGSSDVTMPSRRSQQQPGHDELDQAMRELQTQLDQRNKPISSAAPEDAEPSTLPPRQDAPVDPAVDVATGECTSPWGADLTDGQASMAKQRAKVAGMSDPAVFEAFGIITQANVREALQGLKQRADAALGV